MNRINTIFRLIHRFAWMLLSLLVGLQLWSEGHVYWLTLSTAFLLTCLYVFYGHFYLLTRYFAKKKKGAYFLRLTGIGFTGPFPYLFFHYTAPNFLDYYSLNLVSTVPIFIFLSWLARVTENLVINTIKKEQLEKQAVEAELYYLKSQINPHFLFNTLNNIHTLVYKQAPTASKAVVCLSSLMRYMIYESNAPTVPLSREIDYLRDYISLQQLRYKKSPVVELTLEGDTDGGHIAPLLFIHLLENAYKHSPAWLEPGAIKVKVVLKNDTLTLSIKNPIAKKQGKALGEIGGIGLPNVQKRLALLYPDQHSLEIGSTDGLFTVILEITSLHLTAHERQAHLLYN